MGVQEEAEAHEREKQRQIEQMKEKQRKIRYCLSLNRELRAWHPLSTGSSCLIR